jgi:molybdopterin converting factor small subunit
VTADTTSTVRVRYFAAARAATGLPEETVPLPGPTTVAELTGVVSGRHPRLATIIATCGFLVDGVAVRDMSTRVNPGAEMDVLPPFAGG